MCFPRDIVPKIESICCKYSIVGECQCGDCNIIGTEGTLSPSYPKIHTLFPSYFSPLS